MSHKNIYTIALLHKNICSIKFKKYPPGTYIDMVNQNGGINISDTNVSS